MKTPDLFPQHLIRQGLGIVPDGAMITYRTSNGEIHQAICKAVETGMPLSHRNDPQTSLDAAVSMRDVSGHHRVQVLTALALYGSMTAHEIAAKCGFEHWSVAARRLTELHEHGTIERIKTDMPGVYQTRKTPSGRNACLWRVVRT